jgi:hypothetical protein
MAEYLENAVQQVAQGGVVLLESSIPCNKNYVVHEDGTGIFILRGIVPNTCAKFAQYQVTFNANIALPETATEVVPIAVAIAIYGEARQTSRAIYTPAAVDEYGNVTSTAIIRVPRGCCFSLSIENVPASEDPTVTPAPIINVQNANLTITRIA